MDIVTRRKLRKNCKYSICRNSFAPLWNFFFFWVKDAWRRGNKITAFGVRQIFHDGSASEIPKNKSCRNDGEIL